MSVDESFEEEVFIGRISDKERHLIAKLSRRQTEVFNFTLNSEDDNQAVPHSEMSSDFGRIEENLKPYPKIKDDYTFDLASTALVPSEPDASLKSLVIDDTFDVSRVDVTDSGENTSNFLCSNLDDNDVEYQISDLNIDDSVKCENEEFLEKINDNKCVVEETDEIDNCKKYHNDILKNVSFNNINSGKTELEEQTHKNSLNEKENETVEEISDVCISLVQEREDSFNEISTEICVEEQSVISHDTSSHVFNDTIEEMEKMLKYGLEYFEMDKESRDSNSALKNLHQESQNLDVESKLVTESKIFTPNFDSTHESTFLNKESILVSKSLENKSTEGEEKLNKIPPAKPPRIVLTPSEPNSHSSSENISLQNLQNPTLPNTVNSTPLGTKSIVIKNSSHIPTPMQKSNLHITPTLKSTNIRKYSPSQNHNIPTLVPKNSRIRKHSPSPNHKILTQNTPQHGPPCNQQRVFLSPTRNKVLLNSHSSKSAKVVSRIKSNKKCTHLTPQAQTLFKTPNEKSRSTKISPRYKSKLDIVSPVARYLKNNPPPPLITAIRPKQLSSSKLSKDSAIATKHWRDAAPIERLSLDDSIVKRDYCLKRIDEDLKNLASKANILKTSEASKQEVNKATEEFKTPKKYAPLPASSYHQVEGSVLLENKENISNRRMIEDDSPAGILKHKGHMAIPKNSFMTSTAAQNLMNEQDQANDSLMEVSVYEPVTALHTHTLNRN